MHFCLGSYFPKFRRVYLLRRSYRIVFYVRREMRARTNSAVSLAIFRIDLMWFAASRSPRRGTARPLRRTSARRLMLLRQTSGMLTALVSPQQLVEGNRSSWRGPINNLGDTLACDTPTEALKRHSLTPVGGEYMSQSTLGSPQPST